MGIRTRLRGVLAASLFCSLASFAREVAFAAAQAPFTVSPQAFPGSQGLITLVDFLFYAAWIAVAGMLAYAAIAVHNGGHTSDGFKRALEGVLIGAFLLSFGWAILNGAL